MLLGEGLIAARIPRGYGLVSIGEGSSNLCSRSLEEAELTGLKCEEGQNQETPAKKHRGVVSLAKFGVVLVSLGV